MGIEHCPGRTSSSVQRVTGRKRNKNYSYNRCKEATIYIRRGSKLIRKKCNRTSPVRPDRPGILQHFLPSPKEGRRISTYSESQSSEYIPKSTSFQNGDIKKHSESHRPRRLGTISRSKGCLPSRSHVSSRSQISEILLAGSALPIQGNAIRVGNSAENFYQTDGSYWELPQKEADSSFHVLGRLADQESGQDITVEAIRRDPSVDPEFGSYCQCTEVEHEPVTSCTLSGVSVQYKKGSGPSFRGEVSENSRGDSYYFRNEVCGSSEGFTTTGVNGISHRFDPFCQITYAPNTVLPVVFLAPTQRQFNAVYTSEGYITAPPGMVETSREHFSGSVPTREAATQCDIVDRCFNTRLGSSPGRSSDLGCLEYQGEILPHKLVRNASSSISSDSFRKHTTEQESFVEMRQLDSRVICQQGRGNKVLSTVLPGLGDIQLVQNQEDCNTSCSHTREKECVSRRSVKGSTGSSDNRVESETRVSEPDFSEVLHSEHRPVCNEGEQEVASVLLPLSGSVGLGSRCTQCTLERNVCICVSPASIDTPGITESAEGAMFAGVGCSTLSKTVMVSNPVGSSGRHSKKTTNHGRHADSKEGSDKACRSRVSKSGGMENFQSSSSKRKFSSKAKEYIKQARRASTQRMYQARIAIYRSWCNRRHICPYSASVEELANFFIYLHEERGCKANTVAGYRAAIATVHAGWRGRSVSSNTDLSSLIKGIFNSNPCVKPLLPNWDLPSVLLALCESPFEPLAACNLKYLTWKTVFLLAMATAARVSELQALSVNTNNLRIERAGIRLLPDLQFLAKTQRANKAWKPMFIPRFNRLATDEKDLLLCPCRCLEEYLKRTKDLRQMTENLFITYQSGMHKAAAKSTLSRWIVSLIQQVYNDSPDLTLGDVRAHDTRRLATSWALFNGASLQEIIQAAHWASETTFTTFYLKDVGSEDSFARASVLETAHWAKKKRRK